MSVVLRSSSTDVSIVRMSGGVNVRWLLKPMIGESEQEDDIDRAWRTCIIHRYGWGYLAYRRFQGRKPAILTGIMLCLTDQAFKIQHALRKSLPPALGSRNPLSYSHAHMSLHCKGQSYCDDETGVMLANVLVVILLLSYQNMCSAVSKSLKTPLLACLYIRSFRATVLKVRIFTALKELR